ncbi:MAG TPA: CoA transferase [Acidimicrobiales bacterium]|nr:CoA transferase [Acidimicrobiales bacterium]
MPGPLEGVKVLEFSEMIAAPFAGMHLGDMGADIIKVEPPGGEPWRLTSPFAPTESRTFLALNRNKRGLAIDLKQAAGQEVIHRLVRNMDVVIVNYRPDTPARLGIDYETLSELRPGLIYVENTFLGRRGPDAHRPGYDLAAQAATGLLVTAGRTDGDGLPLPITPAIADFATGLTIASAVCAALFARQRTGEGQRIEASLLATSLALQGATFMKIAADTNRPAADELAELPEEDRRALASYYRAYRTKDSMIAIACLTPVLRRKFAAAVEVEDARHSRELPRLSPESITIARDFTAAVTKRMLERTTAEWLSVMDAAGVPAAPVNRATDLMDDPQVLANDLVVDLDHPVGGRLRMLGPIIRMSATPTEARTPPPTLGQHNDDILSELGYTGGEIEALRVQGIVASGPPPR